MGRCIRGECIESDSLHAICLGKTDGLANHLRTDALALSIRTHRKDMNDSRLIILNLLRPLDGMIVIALIHSYSHCSNYHTIIYI